MKKKKITSTKNNLPRKSSLNEEIMEFTRQAKAKRSSMLTALDEVLKGLL